MCFACQRPCLQAGTESAGAVSQGLSVQHTTETNHALLSHSAAHALPHSQHTRTPLTKVCLGVFSCCLARPARFSRSPGQRSETLRQSRSQSKPALPLNHNNPTQDDTHDHLLHRSLGRNGAQLVLVQNRRARISCARKKRKKRKVCNKGPFATQHNIFPESAALHCDRRFTGCTFHVLFEPLQKKSFRGSAGGLSEHPNHSLSTSI
jgi:hypothetical protein